MGSPSNSGGPTMGRAIGEEEKESEWGRPGKAGLPARDRAGFNRGPWAVG
jgi:hypothetical protein